MTKFFLTAQDEQRIIANQSFEEAMTKCIEILAIVDQKEAIHGFSKLLTEFYQCKMSFICEFDHESTILNGLRKTNEYFGFEVGNVQIKTSSNILREFFFNDSYQWR